MLSIEQKKIYYKALIDRNPEFDGVFYVGVKSTGVFCRSICPARKPKLENCEFYKSAEEALLAGFRPCKRCHPLSHPETVPEVVRKLVEAVEENPEKKWKESDFRKLSISAAQASRLFKKRFGMTFVAFARARRLGLALKQIKEQKSVIDTQINSGYNSGSGFRDAFSKIMGAPPTKSKEIEVLKADWIDTPLGPMIAIADDQTLYLLEFVNRRGLEREIERLRKSPIIPGRTKIIDSIEKELHLYFKGQLKKFFTPIKMIGTPFQKRVWSELKKIPPGQTLSYAEIACRMGNSRAVRAVGSANGANQIAIVIPCHRVINTNGQLGGYGGGLARKKWLLEHEKKI
ncbi:MAG: trifunctional transcriptional activator/DNA repair protein Ada/methylated-DNA--[protein]-cysteine S-methyltransferase [Candidatus Algichlamydia australiensis]|nr:trifunctional transcriptional activator/DNA repair protein Ada/methylated-DNA--[protein]-cysteine S-methyltransferase [Chlamydiales bacterium]